MSIRAVAGTTTPDSDDATVTAVARSVDAFRRILRALRVADRETHAAVGLSSAQLFVLRTLDDGAPASLTELARRTLTDRSSVAAVIDRLAASGLVEREISTTDRRRAAIRITAAGMAMLAHAPAPPTALLLAGLETLPGPQLRDLAAGLTALSSAMGIGGEPAGMLFEDATRKPRLAPARRSR